METHPRKTPKAKLTNGQMQVMPSSSITPLFILSSMYGRLLSDSNDIGMDVYWVRSKTQAIDVNGLFRKLHSIANVNDNLTLHYFLISLDFLYVTFLQEISLEVVLCIQKY